MSTVSDIYDALDTVVTTALPTHKTLNNPYFPENDTELSYQSAYGIAFAEGFNVDGNPHSGSEQRTRSFIVTLTKRKFATARDKATRITTEKALMDDHSALLEGIAESPRLGNPTLIQKVRYEDDGGIEFLTLDERRNNILLIRTTFSVQFEEIVDAHGC